MRSHLVEPFTRQFFRQIKPTRFIGIDQSQLFGNESLLIDRLSGMMPFTLNTIMIDQSMDRYRYLNNNQINLILSRSLEVYNLMYQVTPFFANMPINHVQFVCALYDIPINIMTTEMGVGEFSDLKGSKMTINVGPINSIDYFIAVDLILLYRLTVGQDVYLTHYDVNELFKHYGKDVHVAIISRTHPDTTVENLCNLKLSRMIEIVKYNDGNIYHINLDEEDFYKQHPYYSKAIIEKDRLGEYYPNLVIQEQVFEQEEKKPINDYRSRFINTINMKYYLLSNDQTPRETISQLLYNMKLNMNEVNQFEFIDGKLSTSSLTDFTLPLPVHQGAIDFFQATGLYTNINDPNCVMINGRCDQQQLYEHHLDNRLGPTFDQLFNADPPPVFGRST
jgi:TRAP-type uncharacterized transport system substrate-binding protein